MKWILASLEPPWQGLCIAHCCLRRLLRGCHWQYCRGLQLMIWWICLWMMTQWIIGAERKWYSLQRQDSVLCRHLDIYPTTPLVDKVLTSAIEWILVVTMRRVAETIISFTKKITYGTDLKLVNFVGCRKWESHPKQSDDHYRRAKKPMKQQSCFIRYLNVFCKTINQWLMLTLL